MPRFLARFRARLQRRYSRGATRVGVVPAAEATSRPCATTGCPQEQMPGPHALIRVLTSRLTRSEVLVAGAGIGPVLWSL